jgi:hypothetical protein
VPSLPVPPTHRAANDIDVIHGSPSSSGRGRREPWQTRKDGVRKRFAGSLQGELCQDRGRARADRPVNPQGLLTQMAHLFGAPAVLGEVGLPVGRIEPDGDTHRLRMPARCSVGDRKGFRMGQPTWAIRKDGPGYFLAERWTRTRGREILSPLDFVAAHPAPNPRA